MGDMPWGSNWMANSPLSWFICTRGLNTSWLHCGCLPAICLSRQQPLVTAGPRQPSKSPVGLGHWTLQVPLRILKASPNWSVTCPISTPNCPPVLGRLGKFPGWNTTSPRLDSWDGITTHTAKSERLNTSKKTTGKNVARSKRNCTVVNFLDQIISRKCNGSERGLYYTGKTKEHKAQAQFHLAIAI